ncbi:MAG: hypothetical protein CMK59_06160 [Proteobacteria bacterium]|nr:hypothetical protein [Pseudomonadota bacterium]
MDYQTPGVFIREIDSGPKPIASVATSIPGFLGLFNFSPKADSLAITGSDGVSLITGKVPPALVDNAGKITGDADEATAEITEAMGFKRSNVKDLKSYLKIYGVPLSGKTGATFTQEKSNVKVTYKSKSVTVPENVLNVEGKVVSEDDAAVNDLLNSIHDTFQLSKASPKSADDVLKAFGYSFDSAAETALDNEYSIPPYSVTNKTEFMNWIKMYFAQLIFDTEDFQSEIGDMLVDADGNPLEDEDDLIDAIFDMSVTNPWLSERFSEFLAQPSVFNFVAAVNGFYDNGGGKCYVYLMGTENINGSIRENQADKLGLYAFDDCEDIALMAAPGLDESQQREVLEHCEVRKDRFAVLDGPIVSGGDMAIPASQKGFGSLYVPWFKVKKPSWFKGSQDIEVRGPHRRRLNKASSDEVYVPPSGHLCGIMARVDGERGVHKAPANELVFGITGLSQTINRLEQGQYNSRGINVVRDFKDRGIRVWGARTLATKSNPEWKYINVRRLFIMIEQSIMLGSQWAVFEPNDTTLWNKLTRDLKAYLLRVWRSGALFGATPEEAFYVKCDGETNPRELIDAGQVNVQIGICPVKPAEFVVFTIGQWDGGSLIED